MPLTPRHRYTPDQIATTIGERVRLARKELGLNQTELALRLGVSQPTVANWESGVHDPRRLMLAKMSETLKVPLGWLSEGARSRVERDKQAAAAYLRRNLLHVPVISFEHASRFVSDPELDPHSYAEDYIPVTYGGDSLFAVFVIDDAVDLAFPPDTLVVIDFSETDPSDGTFCLAGVEEGCILRRWREATAKDHAARLEPFSRNPVHKAVYADESNQIIGCVRVSIRFH